MIQQQRSVAIDVLRGMTLALMIVVNMSISEELSYAPLLHATWNGLTLTDVVFPTFLFVVGTAMSFTLEGYERLGDLAMLRKVIRRSALIFLCGYLLYWFPFLGINEEGQLGLLPLEKTRILGVLQRIGLAYGIAALLLHYMKARGAIIYSVLVLLAAWWLMSLFGDYTLSGNTALKLDMLVLGEAHMYKGEGVPFDPEGLFGTFPAVVNVLAGFFAGRFIKDRGANYESIAKLLMAGLMLILVALAWSIELPINKKLWTSSYVLCAIGIDLCLLGLLVFAIDANKLNGKVTYFFEVFGKNTLFIYLFAEVLMSIMWLVNIGNEALFNWIYKGLFQNWAGDKPGSLLFAVIFMLFCWGIGYVMDKKRIYVKL